MRKLIFFALAMAVSPVVFAQWGDEEMSDRPSIRERIFTGGGLGASFGSTYDYVSVSPMIGYKINPKVAAGLQIQYRYTKYKAYSGVKSFSTTDYGVSPFVRWNFYGPLFLHAEYEYLNYVSGLDLDGKKVRGNYNSFLAGGGFFQPMGRNAGFFALALYNFSYKEPKYGQTSPYSSPLVFRAGVTVGF
jgi:hypothetical protein